MNKKIHRIKHVQLERIKIIQKHGDEMAFFEFVSMISIAGNFFCRLKTRSRCSAMKSLKHTCAHGTFVNYFEMKNLMSKAGAALSTRRRQHNIVSPTFARKSFEYAIYLNIQEMSAYCFPGKMGKLRLTNNAGLYAL